MTRVGSAAWAACFVAFVLVAGVVAWPRPAPDVASTTAAQPTPNDSVLNDSVLNDNVLNDNAIARLFDKPLPGVSDPPALPAATGNRSADAQIAAVALDRGYTARGDALDPMGTYQGRKLQNSAISDLAALQSAMRADIGATLTLTSAYRTVDRQRQLFLNQLRTSGLAIRGRTVSNNEIALGLVDDVLNHAMGIAAPPGFSRHHTGLTIDVSSDGFGGFSFANSPANAWLSADNYANAMAFGWIPSYPPDARGLGPNPEPWEWVWIGRDAAACARSQSCASGALDATSPLVTGWAITDAGEPAARFRLVTAVSTESLTVTATARFDVEAAYGLTGSVGFRASRDTKLGKANWTCVEAAEAGGPWSRIGCLDLS